MTVIVSGLGEPEGPVGTADGLFLVEMSLDRRRITRFALDGEFSLFAQLNGRPNGMTGDEENRLWVADRYNGILCIDRGGAEIFRISGTSNARFLWPNDLRFGPDGRLYFTDSGILEAQWQRDNLWARYAADSRQTPVDGKVFAVDPASRTIELIGRDLKFANGIAFGPERALYVSETLTGNIYRYDPRAQWRRELFGNVFSNPAPEEGKGPDGMTFGEDGNLYCTVLAQGDVTVLDPTGKVATRYKTRGKNPTNIAFIKGTNSFVVTETEFGAVEQFDAPCLGAPLYSPRIRL